MPICPKNNETGWGLPVRKILIKRGPDCEDAQWLRENCMRICRRKPRQNSAWFENQELSRQRCLCMDRGESPLPAFTEIPAPLITIILFLVSNTCLTEASFAAPLVLSCWTREDENGFEHRLIGLLIRYPFVATVDRRCCCSIGGTALDISEIFGSRRGF